jgi:IS5 family transposase
MGGQVMARRRIGQEQLHLGGDQHRQTGSLDEIAALIDWSAIEQVLSPIYASAKGEQGWPPLALFKALLLAVWYDVSDVKLAEAIEDRASFRRFCGFASHEATPERTAFVRFRRELVIRSLDRVLFEAVTTQLDSRQVVVRTGTLVDATLIASASIKSDDEARWAGHRRKKPVHGYKAHVATDEAAGLVRSVEVTTANVHDGTMLETLLPHDPGEVYGDSAYAAGRFTDVIRARGGVARVVYTHTWGGPEALARLEAWNASVRAVRCRIEKVFGTWKRSYGLRRMRWLGLAKAGLQVRLTATAYNLRRMMMLVRMQAA